MEKSLMSARDTLSIPTTEPSTVRVNDTIQPGSEKRYGTHTGPWIEVDLDAIGLNYRTFKDLAPTATISPVVKCDGYGLGAAEIARHLVQSENCRSFYVAHTDEGRILHTALNEILPSEQSDSTEIYVLHGPEASTLPIFRDYTLTPVLNTPAQATLWASSFPGKPAILHVDTGMNRLGLSPNDIDLVKDIDDLNIITVMSHLSCAGAPDHPMNARQRAQFLAAAIHFPGARLSLSASGGGLIHESYHYSEIRLGISLYGCTVTDEPDKRLKPVAKLSAPIMQIRKISKGDSVGYDATWKATRASRIATVCLGYGDGYPRRLSDIGVVFIQGVQCPVIGKVSMDMICVDISDLSQGVAVGDPAEIFGPKMQISKLAKMAETTSYEILTGLGQRIERVHLNQS